MNEEPNAFYDEKPEDEHPKENLDEIIRTLKENAPLLKERFNYLISLPQRTPEEIQELLEIAQILRDILPHLQYLESHLFEKVYKQSIAAYYAFKENAEKGNDEAKKAIEHLKPLLDKALLDDINLS